MKDIFDSNASKYNIYNIITFHNWFPNYSFIEMNAFHRMRLNYIRDDDIIYIKLFFI